MKTNITLPLWLDDLLYKKLGAKYYRSNSDMTVIDWCKQDVLNYLGTYFPRSYTESYCIFSQYFSLYPSLCAKTNLKIFDFGCGTGGEIVGFLTALNEQTNLSVHKVDIVALDGNRCALRLYESILANLQPKLQFEVANKVSHVRIDDLYDLSVIDDIYADTTFDIFLSFKAVCEFVTKQQFEQNNAYAVVLNTFLPKLTDDGIALLVDVTSYNSVAEEWLPKMLDAGIRSANGQTIIQNEGYNQIFKISHACKQNDMSKVAYRIIKNK